MVIFWFWFYDTRSECSLTCREKNYRSLGIHIVKDTCTIVSMICGLKKIANRELTKCFFVVVRGYQTLSAIYFLVLDLCTTFFFFVISFYFHNWKPVFGQRTASCSINGGCKTWAELCAEYSNCKTNTAKKRRVYSIATFSVIDGELLKELNCSVETSLTNRWINLHMFLNLTSAKSLTS